MKQLFRLAATVVVVVFAVNQTHGCEVCGCVGGGGSMGLLQLVPRHFVGVRWQQQALATRPHGSGSRSSEIFRQLELRLRWQPHRRWQILATAPLVFNTRNFEETSLEAHRSRGFGDAAILAQFALLDPRRQSIRQWQHSLQIGAGIQLPSGSTNLTDSEGEKLNPNLQPGAGKAQFLNQIFYALRRGNWGASLDATARWGHSANAEGYRFGNRLDGSARIFYQKTWREMLFLPHAGVSLDARSRDFQNDDRLSESGGRVVMGSLGVEIFRGDVAIGFGWQMPVAHQLAKGYVTPKSRFSLSATFLFEGKKSNSKPELPTVFPAVRGL